MSKESQKNNDLDLEGGRLSAASLSPADERLDIGPFSELRVTCHYPDSNSEEVLNDITRGLGYIGLFDNLEV